MPVAQKWTQEGSEFAHLQVTSEPPLWKGVSQMRRSKQVTVAVLDTQIMSQNFLGLLQIFALGHLCLISSRHSKVCPRSSGRFLFGRLSTLNG